MATDGEIGTVRLPAGAYHAGRDPDRLDKLTGPSRDRRAIWARHDDRPLLRALGNPVQSHDRSGDPENVLQGASVRRTAFSAVKARRNIDGPAMARLIRAPDRPFPGDGPEP